MKEMKPCKEYIVVSVHIWVSDIGDTLLTHKILFRKMLMLHLPGKEALLWLLQMLELSLW